ncbi:MAG: RNA 2',3'-cyclic phosphodiesterase [Clostridiales bacterium]|nr:RNA 2',3'-cyclic phosphodiesterase [Clostridiales bacterium]
MRLFIAINFSEELTRELLRAVHSLRQQSARGTFTRPENLHLTLAFIGETDRVNDAEAVLQKVCSHHRSFPITLSGSGRFPGRDRSTAASGRSEGDLYWAGLEKSPALSALAADLQQELRKAGFPIEERAFRPHITLGRRVLPKAGPRPAEGAAQAPNPGRAAEAAQVPNSGRSPGAASRSAAAPIRLQIRPKTMDACWVSLMESERIDGILTYTERASFRLR